MSISIQKGVAVGWIIIAISILFAVYFAFTVNIFTTNKYLKITAIFHDIGGLQTGDIVLVQGLKVGYVSDISLNSQRGTVSVVMNISSKFKIPVDSAVKIVDKSLVDSAKIIKIIWGTNTQSVLHNNDTLTNTKDYVYLDQKINNVINKFVK